MAFEVLDETREYGKLTLARPPTRVRVGMMFWTSASCGCAKLVEENVPR